LLLKLRNAAIGQLTGAGEVARTLRLLQFELALIQLLLQPAFGGDLLALVLPAGGQFGRLLFKVGKFRPQGRQPIL
jgi:hypothetical protein